jgi:hypothetical protein
LASAAVFGVSALAGPSAAAQLPEPRLGERNALPVEPLPGQVLEPAKWLVDEPLPGPLEEVAQESPVAPLREQVREVVAGIGPARPGGDGAGAEPPAGPGGDGARADAAANAAGPGASPSAPRETGRGTAAADGFTGPDGGSAGPGDGDGGAGVRRGRPTRSGDPGAALRPAPAAGGPGSSAARRTGSDRDAEGDGLARTVERIVEVVPGVVWIALGGLAAVALGLGARALVDNRRARALRRDRERLLRDMGLLERALLAQVPDRLGDLAVSVAYRPAAGPAAGGDFYDIFELPGRQVALVVGDVSGHGREALGRTGTLRPTLRAHLEAGLSPRAALAAAGDAAGLDPNGGFTTVVAAVHDPVRGTLTYAGAGHPPPIVIGPQAHEPLTVASGPPIGIGLHTGVRQTVVPLPRGAIACLFTDGLTEARQGRGLLGRTRLADEVARLGRLDSASVLLDHVVERADETPDDMTACLIRTVAGPAVAGPRVEELELEPGELETRAPKRFLEACGVPAEMIATTLADAREVVAVAGRVVLTVTIDAGDTAVSLTAGTREPLAST